MTGPLHDDEIPIDESLVRSLLGTLSTSYDALPLHRLDASGSSNALFRLGGDLLVRLPRQPGGTATIEKERRWLPYVEPALPVAVPEVVEVGGPGFGYPERWSVVRWLTGEPPTPPVSGEPPRHDLARDLAAVVTGLADTAVPASALQDPDLRWYRGEPLDTMDTSTRAALAACREIAGLDLDLVACAEVWDDAVALPRTPDVAAGWYHGDLLAENLLGRDGRLAAVLDFGGLAVGDPTVDLVVAWELLDPAARATFRDLVGVDEATWLRGRAWALALALMTFPYYWTTMPVRCTERLALARAVLADHATT
ncbi:aminoglycoside phosphotransferase family protein [Nocardioides cynanchi]|uniref:aminoglycoside phosphotransferase family protein n=1 Tax=Nocardioides cynanchi TaxID=2558918 RepID=UPI001780870A|nr:aminoglycoside phosphotransferase family protein [Nocardioides cynanchi]